MESKLYVGNLNWKTTEEELKNYFNQFGVVISAKIINDYNSGKSKGFGFVEMSSNEEAETAIKAANEKEFMERKLRVNIAKPQQKRRDNKRFRHQRRY